MKLPKFNINHNKVLDKDMISEFFAENDPVILESFPEIVEQSDVSEVVDMEYKEEIDSIRARIKELNRSTHILENVCEILSAIMDESWDGIDEVEIIVGICPIAPRFLEYNAFLVAHYRDLPTIIDISTHELVHFLYFKKYKKLFPDSCIADYDYPARTWALSELLAPVICNDKRLKGILHSEGVLYPHWQDIKIEDKYLIDIFTDIYKKSKNFDDFLYKSIKKFDQLDEKFGLYNTLTQ